MSITAMKQALEALECIPASGSMLGVFAEQKRVEAIAVLRQALKQMNTPVFEINKMIPAKEFIGELWVRASDHQQAITSLRQAIDQAEKQDVEQSSTESKETFDQPVAFNAGVPPLYPEMKDGETISVEYTTPLNPVDSIKSSKTLDAQPKREQDEAYKAAAYLAKAIFDSLYANKEPYVSGKVVWELCDTTVGVITQIDNMVSQFSPRHPQPQRTWVGLTHSDIDQGLLRSDYAFKTAEAWRAGVVFAMTKLKEKNT